MNGLGVLNSNSQMKDYGKGITLSLPARPLPTVNQIYNMELDIAATMQLRAYKFRIGNIAEARLHAIRIGFKRAELRRMKGEG